MENLEHTDISKHKQEGPGKYYLLSGSQKSRSIIFLRGSEES